MRVLGKDHKSDDYEAFASEHHLKFPNNIRPVKSEFCYCIYLDGFWEKTFKELFKSVSYNLIPNEFIEIIEINKIPELAEFSSKDDYYIHKLLESIELMEGNIEYFKRPLSNDTEYNISHDWIDYNGGSDCFTHYSTKFEEGIIYRVKIDQETKSIINNLKFVYSEGFKFHFDRDCYYFTPIKDVECILYVDSISSIKESTTPYMCSYVDEKYKKLKPKYIYRLLNVDGYSELFESTKEQYYNHKIIEFDKKYWSLVDKGFSKEVMRHLISASGDDAKRNLDKCISCNLIQDAFIHNFDIEYSYRKLRYYSNPLGAYVWREYAFNKHYVWLFNVELGKLDKRLSLKEMSLNNDMGITMICLDGEPFIVHQDMTLAQMVMASIDAIIDKIINTIESDFREYYYNLYAVKRDVEAVIKVKNWHCANISEEENMKHKIARLKTSIADGYIRREEADALRKLAREVRAELKNNQMRAFDRISLI